MLLNYKLVSDKGFEPSNDPIAEDRWVKAEESSPNVEATISCVSCMSLEPVTS